MSRTITKIIDLTPNNQHRLDAITQEGLKTSNGKYSSGDVIEFWSGYNDDIRYRAEIAGFMEDERGDAIYIIWDCYWSPIRDNELTDIKRVRKAFTKEDNLRTTDLVLEVWDEAMKFNEQERKPLMEAIGNLSEHLLNRRLDTTQRACYNGNPINF